MRRQHGSLEVTLRVGFMVVFFCLYSAGQSLTDGSAPRPVSLGEVAVKGYYASHRWVKVTGKYHPGLTLSSTESAAQREKYVALADGRSGGAIMVQLADPDAPDVPRGPVTVTGMLDYEMGDLDGRIPGKLAGDHSATATCSRGETPASPGGYSGGGHAPWSRAPVLFHRLCPDCTLCSAETNGCRRPGAMTSTRSRGSPGFRAPASSP